MYHPPSEDNMHRYVCDACGDVAGAGLTKITAAKNAGLTAVIEDWLFVSARADGESHELYCPACKIRLAQAEGVTTA